MGNVVRIATMLPGPTRVATFAVRELILRGGGDSGQWEYSVRDCALVGIALDMVSNGKPPAASMLTDVENKLKGMQMARNQTYRLARAFFNCLDKE